MNNKDLTEQTFTAFRAYLIREEKGQATIEKYLRDTKAFLAFAGKRDVTKELVMAWKKWLVAAGYAPRAVNAKLAGLNSLLAFMGREDCRVKNLKIQQQTYCPEEKELTKAEYKRLLGAAKHQPRLRLMLETICSTGIRVSELKYFTVEAVGRGEIRISNKGKNRAILIPARLERKLLAWAKEAQIESGAIFITKNGKPLDRSNIWAKMKKLCESADVAPGKVFPHNLRKLFARCFYELEKDIAKLADILGHSSINTTRIYIMGTGTRHRRQLDRLGLIS